MYQTASGTISEVPQTQFQSARIAPSISPTHGLPLKMIALAFAELHHVRRGQPTDEAISAMRWLSADSFEPASFRWACHWLNLDPEKVRRDGLPHGNVVHQYRGGMGVTQILNRWHDQARIRFLGRTSPSITQRRQGGAIPRSSVVL